MRAHNPAGYKLPIQVRDPQQAPSFALPIRSLRRPQRLKSNLAPPSIRLADQLRIRIKEKHGCIGAKTRDAEYGALQ